MPLSYILLHLPHAHPLLITWLPISLRKLMQLEEKVCRLPPLNLPHSLPISLHTQPSSCYRDESTVIIHPSLLHFLLYSGSFPSLFKLIIFYPMVKKNFSWCYFPLQQEPHFSPSFMSKAFVRIFYTCKGLYCSSLLNPLSWCFCPHDSRAYILIKDSDDISVTMPTHQFSVSSHWPISSFGYIWSLSPTPRLLPSCLPGLLPGLPICPPFWLFHLRFYASFSRLSDLYILEETKTHSVDLFPVDTHTVVSSSVSKL